MKPKFINIMGKKIKIVYKDLKDNHGEFDGDLNTIYISKTLKGQMLKDTILHEAIHAVFYYTGINNLFSRYEDEEATVRAIENNLFEVIRRYEKK